MFLNHSNRRLIRALKNVGQKLYSHIHTFTFILRYGKCSEPLVQKRKNILNFSFSICRDYHNFQWKSFTTFRMHQILENLLNVLQLSKMANYEIVKWKFSEIHLSELRHWITKRKFIFKTLWIIKYVHLVPLLWFCLDFSPCEQIFVKN